VIGPLLVQAFWLSAIYLLLGAAVAGVRRYTDTAFLSAFSVGLDGPAHEVLERTGLWERLLRGYALGQVKPWQWRAILAGVTVLVIHVQALLLGIILTAARALFLRTART
jgi:hypothetical protein